MNSKPKKILLLGAGFTTRNMGVWALASGTINSAWHAYPNAQIYLLDYNVESANYKIKHPGGTSVVQLINIRFSKKFWLPNNILRLLLSALLIRAVPSRSINNWLLSRNSWLHHIKTSDFACSIAGGDSFSDIYGLGRLIYVALPQILVMLMGKQLVLLPQTIGPFNSLLGKTMARYILKHARKIYSRDKEGLDIQNMVRGVRRRITFCYDMGFALEPQIAEDRIPPRLIKLNKNVPILGLNISGLLFIGGYTRKNMFGLKTEYRKLILDLIGYFVNKYNAHIMLVPHVLGSGVNSESDFTACNKIYHESEDRLQEHLTIISEKYDQHELKAIIGHCDFFLGSRMHACIAALSQCVPAIGLAYSRKFRGVYESIGIAEMVVDLRDYDADHSLELIQNAYRKRIEFREKLKAEMPAVRETVLNLFVQSH